MKSSLFGAEGDFYLFADWLAVLLFCCYFIGCLEVKVTLKFFVD